MLEMARRYFCQHVVIAPEAASIVFSGGFPRSDLPKGRRAVQRAIFHVQKALETVALESHRTAVVLCDRGTLDGLAYWAGSRQSFFEEFGIDFEKELNRYSAVVHVQVPALARSNSCAVSFRRVARLTACCAREDGLNRT